MSRGPGPSHDRRGRRLYDWWSDHRRLFGLLARAVFGGRESAYRREALDLLALDVGCGAGVNAESLASGVAGTDDAPRGRVLGVDYSAGMLAEAREAARDAPAGADVELARVDAARLPVDDDSVDAAYATLSLSAMADPETVVDEVARCLRPDGRVVVFDTRPVQSGPLRPLNPVWNRLSTWATNWRPDVDLVDLLDARFDRVDVRTHAAGSVFVVRAEQGDDDGG